MGGRTHLPAALAYLFYVVVSRLAFWPSKAYVDAIVSENAGQWLGSTVGERIANYPMLSSTLGYTIQTVLFVWLVLGLVNPRPSGNKRLPWQDKQRSSSALPT